jgi:cytoskeletal protein CcmA (bactofilin family)
MFLKKRKKKGMDKMTYSSEEGYSNDENSRTLMTITGSSAKIEGNLTISESIEVDCEVKGSMTIDGQIIIQKDGFVAADVKTKDAEIIGKYEGSMEASGKVVIKESGIVNGSIKTDSLIISEGGIFSGDVKRMSSDSDSNTSKSYQSESEENKDSVMGTETEEHNSNDEDDDDGLSLE